MVMKINYSSRTMIPPFFSPVFLFLSHLKSFSDDNFGISVYRNWDLNARGDETVWFCNATYPICTLNWSASNRRRVEAGAQTADRNAVCMRMCVCEQQRYLQRQIVVLCLRTHAKHTSVGIGVVGRGGSAKTDNSKILLFYSIFASGSNIAWLLRLESWNVS